MTGFYKWSNMITGEVVMLFIGIVYAWSILKEPFSSEFGWTASSLAFNFTVTMICFCLGQLLAGVMLKRISLRLTVITAAVLAFLGFSLTSFIDSDMKFVLYITYGILAGTGMGMMFNISVSIPGSWFPKARGTCIGALMMGFGTSTLIMGKFSYFMMVSAGWRTTYRIIGITTGLIIAFSAFVFRYPTDDLEGSVKKTTENENPRQYSTSEMVHTKSFWTLVLFLILASSLGNSTISMARDVAVYEGAGMDLATLLVGLLSLCNGLSRFLIGVVYDRKGQDFTLKLDAIIVLSAAVIALAALKLGGALLASICLCLIGFSYGCQPIVTSSTISNLYGNKNFSMNFAIANLSIIVTSLVTTISGILLQITKSFYAPYIMLLVFAIIALFLSSRIRTENQL